MAILRLNSRGMLVSMIIGAVTKPYGRPLSAYAWNTRGALPPVSSTTLMVKYYLCWSFVSGCGFCYRRTGTITNPSLYLSETCISRSTERSFEKVNRFYVTIEQPVSFILAGSIHRLLQMLANTSPFTLVFSRSKISVVLMRRWGCTPA